MKKVKKIGLIGFQQKNSVFTLVDRLIPFLKEKDITLVSLQMNHVLSFPHVEQLDLESFRKEVDMIMSLGGDGTFLSSVRFILFQDIPVLGINLGTVGFLSYVNLENVEDALDKVFANQYEVVDRICLDIKIEKDGETCFEDVSLNEVILVSEHQSQLVKLNTFIDGDFFSQYWSDGLIVSTPTGSTAYSMSAGGPILHPLADCFLLVPMNSFSLSVRPFVMSSEKSLTITSPMTLKQDLKIVIDGRREVNLPAGVSVHISKSFSVIRFIKPKGYSFLHSIRTKFGWRGCSTLK